MSNANQCNHAFESLIGLIQHISDDMIETNIRKATHDTLALMFKYIQLFTKKLYVYRPRKGWTRLLSAVSKS